MGSISIRATDGHPLEPCLAGMGRIALLLVFDRRAATFAPSITPAQRLGEEIAMVQIRINGQTIETDAEPGTPLLWVLRDEIGLTGTKFGCGAGLCGACTVHVDGQATRSCITPVEAVAGAEVTTIEGLSSAIGRRVQEAWIAEQVPQCGYCQPGMIMAATALLMEKPRPSDTDINAAMTNLCRCGTYARIRRAIHSAANA